MKNLSLFILVLVSLGEIFCQKNIKVGDKSITIKGEIIYSFEELIEEDDEPSWVDIYLFISVDSIIVTEIQKRTPKTEIYENVIIFDVSKQNIDFSKTSIGKHNTHHIKPTNLYKVQLHTINFEDKIVKHTYKKNEYINENIHDIRVLVRDIDQGIAVKNKLSIN